MVLYKIPLPIYPHYRILNKNVGSFGTKLTVMIPIDEEEEKLIDNISDTTLHFKRGNTTFNVTMKDIYCYGEVDFTSKEELNQIDNFNFLDYLGAVGVRIWSRYDYLTHSCESTSKRLMWTETFHPSQLALMAHGYLGKPKRILLFNETFRKR